MRAGGGETVKEQGRDREKERNCFTVCARCLFVCVCVRAGDGSSSSDGFRLALERSLGSAISNRSSLHHPVSEPNWQSGEPHISSE